MLPKRPARTQFAKSFWDGLTPRIFRLNGMMGSTGKGTKQKTAKYCLRLHNFSTTSEGVGIKSNWWCFNWGIECFSTGLLIHFGWLRDHLCNLLYRYFFFCLTSVFMAALPQRALDSMLTICQTYGSFEPLEFWMTVFFCSLAWLGDLFLLTLFFSRVRTSMTFEKDWSFNISKQCWGTRWWIEGDFGHFRFFFLHLMILIELEVFQYLAKTFQVFEKSQHFFLLVFEWLLLLNVIIEWFLKNDKPNDKILFLFSLKRMLIVWQKSSSFQKG